MKNYYYLLLLIVLSAFCSDAQIPSVATPKATSIQPPVTPKREYFFTVSYLNPVGAFGEDYKLSSNVSLETSFMNSMQGTAGGMGASGGYNIDIGEEVFYNKNPSYSIAGLKITFLSFSSVPFKWYTASDYIYNNAAYKKIAMLSFKIGPVYRIYLSPKSALHLYYQLCPSMAWNGSWSNTLDYTQYDDNQNKYIVHDVSTFKMGTGYGLKNEIGATVTVADRLALGISYSFGNIKFKSVQFDRNGDIVGYLLNADGSYIYAASQPYYSTVNIAPSMPNGFVLFSVGLLFASVPNDKLNVKH